MANKNKPRPNAAFVSALPSQADSEDGAVPSSSAAVPTPDLAPSAELRSHSEAKPAVQEVQSGPSNADASDALAVQLQQYPVLEAPPYTLPDETIKRDRQMARKAAEDRGEIPSRDADTDHYDRDADDNDDGDDAGEDVNGFMATAAGKRAAAKKKVSTVSLHPYAPHTTDLVV